ncbi:MAG: class I SAM-dependent methyltransferase [Desulfobacterota bacterium]|nr:class I SAM-dependent methyltransferase [Thermodesulfobacteriota bacterium]
MKDDVHTDHQTPSMCAEEIARLKEYYAQRDITMPWHDWHLNMYHPRHPLGFLFFEHHHAILIEALNKLQISLENYRILDIGCGYGHWLRFLVELGAAPERMAGVDISTERLAIARKANPAIAWIKTAGNNLPFAPASFDLVMQILVFSSIRSSDLRKTIADAIVRVTKSGGYLFWIDHQRSLGDGLVGFSRADVLSYFPGMRIVYTMPVQPRYFRFFYRTAGWFARLLYGWTKRWCDSWFLILQKSTSGI